MHLTYFCVSHSVSTFYVRVCASGWFPCPRLLKRLPFLLWIVLCPCGSDKVLSARFISPFVPVYGAAFLITTALKDKNKSKIQTMKENKQTNKEPKCCWAFDKEPEMASGNVDIRQHWVLWSPDVEHLSFVPSSTSLRNILQFPRAQIFHLFR